MTDPLKDSTHLGIGVLIGLVGGNDESVEVFREAIGKKIETVALIDDALRFIFEDSSKMKLFDDGQSCCETRYMHTDDQLEVYRGAVLLSAEVRDAPDVPDEENEYGTHEVQFLVVTTDKGAFTIATHNEHNGYYGGFLIRAARDDDDT